MLKTLFLISDIRTLWRSGLSARVPECQKLIMVRRRAVIASDVILSPEKHKEEEEIKRNDMLSCHEVRCGIVIGQ